MTTQALTLPPMMDTAPIVAGIEKALTEGDLSGLSATERVLYLRRTCESLGLNPLTQPFQYIKFEGKLTLYARKDAAEQLRRRDRISLTIVDRYKDDEVYIVTARATTPDGRTDEGTGAVTIAGLKGQFLANAIMKAETKAKRRVTLSIAGLGWLDESEIETVPGATVIEVDQETGEILSERPAAPSRQAPRPPAASRTIKSVDETKYAPLSPRGQHGGRMTEAQAIPATPPAGPPHPDAVALTLPDGTQDTDGGRPLWQLFGLVCVTERVGARIVAKSAMNCGDHDSPFYFNADTREWTHGKGAERCVWQSVDDADEGEL